MIDEKKQCVPPSAEAILKGTVEKVQKAGHCDPAFGGGSNLTPYGSMG
jgi:hypothetical protein